MTFCKHLYHRKCKRRGVRGQKKPNLVNVVCERPLSGISCYMTIYWPPNIRHCDCTMKYWFIKKEWHSLQKNCQENQKNIHWNSVTTSGYGPTDATAELTWPSTTPQWGQNLSEVGFELIFYHDVLASWTKNVSKN